ncbi:MAG: hypothetical protein ACREUW_05120 [Burkholderiales bacterium]
MKTLIAAALTIATLTGCIAVPVYGPGPRAQGGYAYPAPPPPPYYPRHNGDYR